MVRRGAGGYKLVHKCQRTDVGLLVQPSATLQGYFKGCDEDVTPEILKRVQELSNAIFPPPQVPSGVGFQQLSVYRERRLEVRCQCYLEMFLVSCKSAGPVASVHYCMTGSWADAVHCMCASYRSADAHFSG